MLKAKGIIAGVVLALPMMGIAEGDTSDVTWKKQCFRPV